MPEFQMFNCFGHVSVPCHVLDCSSVYGGGISWCRGWLCIRFLIDKDFIYCVPEAVIGSFHGEGSYYACLCIGESDGPFSVAVASVVKF